MVLLKLPATIGQARFENTKGNQLKKEKFILTETVIF